MRIGSGSELLKNINIRISLYLSQTRETYSFFRFDVSSSNCMGKSKFHIFAENLRI
jgi:hypothetical protein